MKASDTMSLVNSRCVKLCIRHCSKETQSLSLSSAFYTRLPLKVCRGSFPPSKRRSVVFSLFSCHSKLFVPLWNSTILQRTNGMSHWKLLKHNFAHEEGGFIPMNLFGEVRTLQALKIDIYDFFFFRTIRNTERGVCKHFLCWKTKKNVLKPHSSHENEGLSSDVQVPGSTIILGASRADKLFSEDEREKKIQQLMNTLIKTENTHQEFLKREITRLAWVSKALRKFNVLSFVPVPVSLNWNLNTVKKEAVHCGVVQGGKYQHAVSCDIISLQSAGAGQEINSSDWWLGGLLEVQTSVCQACLHPEQSYRESKFPLRQNRWNPLFDASCVRMSGLCIPW